MRYIPDQDPMQDALKKSKKAMYFKLTLPNTRNELKVAVCSTACAFFDSCVQAVGG